MDHPPGVGAGIQRLLRPKKFGRPRVSSGSRRPWRRRIPAPDPPLITQRTPASLGPCVPHAWHAAPSLFSQISCEPHLRHCLLARWMRMTRRTGPFEPRTRRVLLQRREAERAVLPIAAKLRLGAEPVLRGMRRNLRITHGRTMVVRVVTREAENRQCQAVAEHGSDGLEPATSGVTGRLEPSWHVTRRHGDGGPARFQHTLPLIRNVLLRPVTTLSDVQIAA